MGRRINKFKKMFGNLEHFLFFTFLAYFFGPPLWHGEGQTIFFTPTILCGGGPKIKKLYVQYSRQFRQFGTLFIFSIYSWIFWTFKKKWWGGINIKYGWCYKVSIAYFLLLHYYSGRAVAKAMCQAGGCGGYVSALLNENKANSAQLCWVGAKAELGKNKIKSTHIRIIALKSTFLLRITHNLVTFQNVAQYTYLFWPSSNSTKLGWVRS